MSSYQSFKLFLVEAFHISKDGFHIILGFLVFLFGSYIFKIKLSSYKALIVPLVFALILETKDIFDSVSLGLFPDLYDSFRDIIITFLLPLLTVMYNRYWIWKQ